MLRCYSRSWFNKNPTWKEVIRQDYQVNRDQVGFDLPMKLPGELKMLWWNVTDLECRREYHEEPLPDVFKVSPENFDRWLKKSGFTGNPAMCYRRHRKHQRDTSSHHHFPEREDTPLSPQVQRYARNGHMSYTTIEPQIELV